MTVRRTDEGSRLTLTQHGFVGTRGTLRRRVLHRSYAEMLGAPLLAALDRLEDSERDRAALARRRGGALRSAAGPNRRNDRAFRRIPKQAGRTAPDLDEPTVPSTQSGSSTGARRRLAVRRSPDGRPHGRASVPALPTGAGRSADPATVVGALGPDEPTIALPPFPVRVRAHQRKVPVSTHVREIVAAMRGLVGGLFAAPARWVGEMGHRYAGTSASPPAAARAGGIGAVPVGAGGVQIADGGVGVGAAGSAAVRRTPVVSGAALLLVMAIFATLLDRATAPHPPAPPQVGGAAAEPLSPVLPGLGSTSPMPGPSGRGSSGAGSQSGGQGSGAGSGAPVAAAPGASNGAGGPGGGPVAGSTDGTPAGTNGGGPTQSAVYRTGGAFVGGYRGIVTINNLSSTPLDGWTATVTLPPLGLIVHDVGGAEYRQAGKDVTFTPLAGTRVVQPGTSIEITFEVQGVGEPVACRVNGQPCSGVPG
jgi:hypothetical protein